MNFTPDETKKLKAMLAFCVKRKNEQSDGKSGFHIMELEPILEELDQDGTIKMRPTINRNAYFLNTK